MALVNRAVTSGFGATILPGLELRDGVPAQLRTLVAVPILLTTQAALEEQIERLEIHYLASPEGELHFALLSDWTDAATETVAGDDALLDAAAAGIARLNRRYGPAAGGRPLPPAPSPAGLERRAAALDGLGTQARQAPRAEPAAARRDRYDLRGRRRTARRRRPPASATSSRSMPIRGCRAKRPAGWSARWRTRSTVRGSMPARGASSKAMACCSRASRRRCRSAAKARCSSASSPA